MKSLLFVITSLVEMLQEVEVDGSLRLNVRVVALIELLLDCFLISVGCDREHLPPQTIVLTVRETEHVVFAYYVFKLGCCLPVIP